MRMDSAAGTALCALACSGCKIDVLGDDWGGDDSWEWSYSEEPAGPAYDPPPEECRPSDAVWEAMRRIHDDTACTETRAA